MSWFFQGGKAAVFVRVTTDGQIVSGISPELKVVDDVFLTVKQNDFVTVIVEEAIESEINEMDIVRF